MEPLSPAHADWMPDAASPACLGGCARPFTVFRRRHHCRACGRLICADCSGLTMLGRARGMHRVCGDTASCRAATAAAAPAVPAPLPSSGRGDAPRNNGGDETTVYLQPTSQDGYTRQPLVASSHGTGLPELVCRK